MTDLVITSLFLKLTSFAVEKPTDPQMDLKMPYQGVPVGFTGR
jgi:hypothetical protein